MPLSQRQWEEARLRKGAYRGFCSVPWRLAEKSRGSLGGLVLQEMEMVNVPTVVMCGDQQRLPYGIVRKLLADGVVLESLSGLGPVSLEIGLKNAVKVSRSCRT